MILNFSEVVNCILVKIGDFFYFRVLKILFEVNWIKQINEEIFNIFEAYFVFQ